MIVPETGVLHLKNQKIILEAEFHPKPVYEPISIFAKACHSLYT